MNSWDSQRRCRLAATAVEMMPLMNENPVCSLEAARAMFFPVLPAAVNSERECGASADDEEDHSAHDGEVADYGETQNSVPSASAAMKVAMSFADNKQLLDMYNKKYYWELGRNLPQEILHRRECGKEAYKGAQNFRSNERRAKARLFLQHHIADPSRFYKEASRHPDHDIIDAMAAAVLKNVVLFQRSSVVN